MSQCQENTDARTANLGGSNYVRMETGEYNRVMRDGFRSGQSFRGSCIGAAASVPPLRFLTLPPRINEAAPLISRTAVIR